MSAGLGTPLGALPAVGEKRAAVFAKLGLRTIGDLLHWFPRRYHDLRNFKRVSELLPDEIASVKCRVLARERRRAGGRLEYLKAAVGDGTGVLYLVFFNQAWLEDVFIPDAEFFINGRVEFFRGETRMTNPLYEQGTRGRRDWLLPVYPLAAGLTQGFMRKLVAGALEAARDAQEELLPFPRRQALGLSNARFALENIHFPRSDANLEKARHYLIFHEFFRLQIGLAHRRAHAAVPAAAPGDAAAGEPAAIVEFEKLLPFAPTAGQRRAMEEIVGDVARGRRVQRLVQGDVGAGKTVVAVFMLWLFARMGRQGVFLSPTEILAEQHFFNWQGFFAGLGMPADLVVGQMSARERAAVAARAASGETKVLIGTHALLSDWIEIPELRAVVVDEQHKFGVRQREELRRKGAEAHYLIMSATPIPRSLALTFYGSLDVSTIGDLPAGKRRVTTYLLPREETERVFGFVEEQLAARKQGFLVTPAIEGGNEDIVSAEEEFAALRERFPGAPIGMIHGRMPHDEKERAMDDFRSGRLLLLVATTVVESGIDVPEASYMVVTQAERYGLAQLHQLRGRVGRKGEPGYCFLISRTSDATILDRLERFAAAETGLEIAEMDLKLRGPGELLGTRQHGMIPLRIGDIVADIRTLDLARTEAERVCAEDPDLVRPEHEAIRRLLAEDTVHGT